MAWPFTSVGQPNKDSGFVAVPAVVAAPANFDLVSLFWLLGIYFANDSDSDVVVLVTDGSGAIVVPHIRIPPHGIYVQPPVEFMPVVGLQWRADGVPPGGVVNGKVWGYA